MMKRIILGICIAAFATALSAQDLPQKLYCFSFDDAPLNAVLDRLQDITGKDITVDLGVTATVTLSVSEKVTADEGAALIIQALQEEGLRLESLDENTIRVRGNPNPEATTSSHGKEALKLQEESKAKKGRLSYAEQRRSRQKPGEIPKGVYSGKELEKHLRDYQMEMIRAELPPPPVQLTPENTDTLNREDVTVPARLIPEDSSGSSSPNDSPNE